MTVLVTFAVFWFQAKEIFRGHEQKAIVGFASLFRPRYPDFLHGAPQTAARAAFIKESRMKFASASKVHRKSGVR